MDRDPTPRRWFLTGGVVVLLLLLIAGATLHSQGFGWQVRAETAVALAKAVAGFLMVGGAIGLVFNGMFALFEWAEARSSKDEEFEKAWAATFEDGETDRAEAFYRKLLPLWTVLFVVGALGSVVAVLLD